jgi:phage tail-like protein
MAGQTANRADAFATFRFRISVSDPDAAAEFSECGGLEMQVKYDEVREGGQNDFVHRLPTRVEYGNLTLKRGYARSNDFFRWCASIASRGAVERKNVTVTLINLYDSQEVCHWTFLNAYPVKWSGPAFKASDNAVAIESLELAHEGLGFP